MADRHLAILACGHEVQFRYPPNVGELTSCAYHLDDGYIRVEMVPSSWMVMCLDCDLLVEVGIDKQRVSRWAAAHRRHSKRSHRIMMYQTGDPENMVPYSTKKEKV